MTHVLEAKGERTAFERGRREAVNDCIGILRKWFWGTNKDARRCEDEMRALVVKDSAP